MTRARRWLDDVAGALDAAAGPLDAPPLDEEAALAVLADLEGRHAEPARHYHTIDHVDAVLAALDELTAAESADPPARTVAALAAWFHDAVYDPTDHGNEPASAELARGALSGLGVGRATVDEVARLIELTAGHRLADDDVAGALLADADLSILGADPAAYDRYAEQIRAEYAHVPVDAYRVGRADILAGFLDRPRIYRTRAGRARWERRARVNLGRERRALLTG